MKKVLFAVKNMDVGGVEKSLLSLLDTIDTSEYLVDILLLQDSGGFRTSLPKWVNVIVVEEYSQIADELNKPPLVVVKKHISNKRVLRALQLMIGYGLTKITHNQQHYYNAVFHNVKKVPEKYDIAISYTSLIPYLTWYVVNHVVASSYIGWIHFDVSKLNFDRRFVYDLHKNMKTIYVVSNEARDSFVKEYPMLAEKCQVRYNVVNKTEILKLSDMDAPNIKMKNSITIITLGRLTAEKGQDIIPEVAQRLKEQGVSFCWYIIGDGNSRIEIERRITLYKVENQVILLGTITNPYPYLKQADIYVQTSIHEGFCITLAEAKVFGMPIISTEFAGAHEQLDMVANSAVVPRNVDDLTKAVYSVVERKYEIQFAP